MHIVRSIDIAITVSNPAAFSVGVIFDFTTT